MKKIELLVPVGNKDCLFVAINNGADAVYLGGKKFGARAYSNNFNEEELIEAVKICHLYGVKVYVTVNTMIYNSEVEEFLNYINFLYVNNVDAVIMQDNGMIGLVRNAIPDLEVHVSTQAHNHNKPAIEYYKSLGCTRVVFDRELSLQNIKDIDIDIEKEVFVYGALCICYSGNCLFSSLNGGRSANRGMCVGSCRLPYALYKNEVKEKEGYILSTKDLNTLPKLKDILDSGVDSLKIEGRMKSKEYVAVVTKMYRKLIDNYYAGKELVFSLEDNEMLLKTYNREFTTGYLFNQDSIINDKTSNHQGVGIGTVIGVNNKRITIKLDKDLYQNDAIRFDKPNKGMYVNLLYNEKGLLVSSVSRGNVCQVDNKERIMIKDVLGSNVLKTIDTKLNDELNKIETKKIPVNMYFKAFIGENSVFMISDNINSVEVYGNVVEHALNAPITTERIKEQLSKLGNTPFRVNDVEILIDDNIFINLKEINELRRKAVEQLINKREGSPLSDKLITIKDIPYKTAIKTKISILTRNEEQLKLAIANKIDIIYTTKEDLYNKYKDNNIFLRLDRVINVHTEYENENLLCTELGSIVKYGRNNNVRTDYYLNAANDYTITKYLDLNSRSVTVSVESNINQINDIKNKRDSELIIYGYLECMIIKNNIFNIKDESVYIKDLKGNKYKILFNRFTHVFNHEPINMIDKIHKFKGFGTLRIELLDENVVQVQTLINRVKSML